MAKADKKTQYLAIRSLFVSNNIQKMKDLEDLSPTAIAKHLKINHSRYIEKLYKPDTFTIKNIRAFATLLDLDPRIIIEVILKQVPSASNKKKKQKE